MAWDNTLPADGSQISASAGLIRNNWDAIVAGDVTNLAKWSLKSRTALSAGDPSTTTDVIHVYGKDVNGKVELFAWDESGNEVQITNAGLLYSQLVQHQIDQLSTAVFSTTAFPIAATAITFAHGSEDLSISITPKSASNILVIEAYYPYIFSSAVNGVSIALFQDATLSTDLALSVATARVDAAGGFVPLYLKYKMVAGTTSSTTFKIRYGTQSGTAYVGRNGAGVALFNALAHRTIEVKEYLP